jgi:diguanylate cyclase (GGDEF)-like protein
LLYAQALLRRGDATGALKLLEPHASLESDGALLSTLGEALTVTGDLDRARSMLERLPLEEPATVAKLFDLAGRYMEGRQDAPAVALLHKLQQSATKTQRENDFAIRLDRLAESYAQSPALAEFCAAAYAEMNRESRYFDALVRLFDIYLEAGEARRAGEALDKLVEIDPYDFGNQQRLEKLEGRADDAMVGRIRARLAQIGLHAAQPSVTSPALEGAVGVDRADGDQALEDLIVQAEIFMQYSLKGKAIERLQKIAQLFPGEEENNERLRDLCQMASWWPAGANGERMRAKAQGSSGTARPAGSAPDSAETLRDLSKISEISQALHRQPSARAILSTAIQEVGQHFRATRCMAAVGTAGRPPQMASEFCAPGVEPTPGALLVRLLAQLEQAAPNGIGGLTLESQMAPVLRELGLETALGVSLIDPETRAQSGMMVAGYATAHAWRPHETYFLQAVGNQMLLGVHHTRLRTLTRTLRATDEKTGLLARSSYLDCLMNEAQRAKSQGSTLSVVLVQMDHGAELLEKHGEAQLERYIEQLARALDPVTRQGDLAVKYTSWSFAFMLPDTALAGAESQAEKIRQAGAGIRPPWEGTPPELSASVAEAVARPDYDGEDIVTELINRAESGLGEARRRCGHTVVALGNPVS